MNKFYSLFTVLFLLMTVSNIQAQRSLKGQILQGEIAKEVYPTAAKVRVNEQEESIKYIQFDEGEEPQISELNTVLSDIIIGKKQNEDVDEFTFRVLEDKITNLGNQRLKVQQYYNGIPIEFSTILVEVNEGRIQKVRGNIFTDIEISTIPFLDAQQASRLARKNFEDQDHLDIHQADLVILKQGDQDHLCWKVDIFQHTNSKRFYVDAHTATIIYTLPLAVSCATGSCNTPFYGNQTTTTQLSGGNYILHNSTCNAPEVHTVNWNSDDPDVSYTVLEYQDTNNSWNDNDSDRSGFQAHWLANQAIEFFEDIFNRNSYDDAGGRLLVYNEYSGNGGNGAYFVSSTGTMYLGRGSNFPSNSDDWNVTDIVGHELTHGVTGSSSNLIYQKEPGALNESFSDIFGVYFEQWLEGDNASNWLVGEDLTSYGTLRNMANPNQFNQPDTYEGNFWYNVNGCSPIEDNDYCGVHVNSGVQNYWFYLLTDGDSGVNDNGDAYDVQGIGIAKAAEIAYNVLINKLTSTSDHEDARIAAIDVASDLYGACSNEVIQVTNAWYAVGVGAESTCSTNTGNDAPDLVVEDVNGNPTATVGSNYTVSFDVTNQGTAPTSETGNNSGYSYVKYFLSDDMIKDNGDDDLGNANSLTSILDPNESQTISKTLSLPSNVTGNKYLLIYADKDGNVGESNETNNIGVFPINITDGTSNSCEAPSINTVQRQYYGNYTVIKVYAYHDAGETQKFRYRAVGDTEWINGYNHYTKPTGNAYSRAYLRYLSNCTDYEVQIGRVCDNGQTIYSTDVKVYKTREIAPTTESLTVDTYCGWARLYCHHYTGQQVRFRYRPVGSSAWTSTGYVTSHFIVVNDLQPGVNYEYQALARCPGSTLTSTWSPLFPFSMPSCKSEENTSLNQQTFELSVYPNPTTNFINIEMSGENIAGPILIYDVQGRLVKEIALEGENPNLIQADISDLINGVYIINVGGQLVERITKF